MGPSRVGVWLWDSGCSPGIMGVVLGKWVWPWDIGCVALGAVTKTRTGRGLDWSWTGIKTIVELSFHCLNSSSHMLGCVFILGFYVW